MLFDKVMKYKVGDRLVLNNGNTVVVEKVDAKHGEYHVINVDDEEDFSIIVERDVVVEFGKEVFTMSAQEENKEPEAVAEVVKPETEEVVEKPGTEKFVEEDNEGAEEIEAAAEETVAEAVEEVEAAVEETVAEAVEEPETVVEETVAEAAEEVAEAAEETIEEAEAVVEEEIDETVEETETSVEEELSETAEETIEEAEVVVEEAVAEAVEEPETTVEETVAETVEEPEPEKPVSPPVQIFLPREKVVPENIHIDERALGAWIYRVPREVGVLYSKRIHNEKRKRRQR